VADRDPGADDRTLRVQDGGAVLLLGRRSVELEEVADRTERPAREGRQIVTGATRGICEDVEGKIPEAGGLREVRREPDVVDVAFGQDSPSRTLEQRP